MSIDIEATKTNERFIQAELYCKLKNEMTYERILSRSNRPLKADVLIEASIKENKSTKKTKARKRADLVLIWK